MSAGRDNKFLIIFSAVVGLGAISLGVLLFLEHKSYAEISTTYDQKAKELQRLQGLKPYPDAENLAALVESKDALEASITTLRSQLASRSIPLEAITPNQFQDRLREMLAEVTKLATEYGVQLADDFYLGFGQYQDIPPSAGAAPELYRQLKAVNAIVRSLIECRVLTLSVERPPIAAESGQPPRPPAGGGTAAAVAPVLERNILRIRFDSEAGVLRQAVNALVSAEQFLIIRTLSVQNEKLEGPPRQEQVASAPVVESFMGTEAATEPPVAQRLEFIVGKEKISADLRVEMVDFLKPETEQPEPAAAQ